jgi:hypothetical protein
MGFKLFEISTQILKVLDQLYQLLIPILHRPGRGTHMFWGVVFQQPTDTGAHPLLFPDLIPVFCQALAVVGSSSAPPH